MHYQSPYFPKVVSTNAKIVKCWGLDFRATLSWNHLFADKHITNFFAGMEINDLQRTYSSFKVGECNILWEKFHHMYINF